MLRRIHTWIIFGVCLVAVIVAIGWISRAVLRVDRAETAAREQAELEGNVRLALWRIDALLAPFLARQIALPVSAYTATFRLQEGTVAADPGEAFVPSPVLTPAADTIRLHFQYGPDGALSSPQVPTGPWREPALACCTNPTAIREYERRLQAFQSRFSHEQLLAALRTSVRQSRAEIVLASEFGDLNSLDDRQVQNLRSSIEWNKRADVYREMVAQPVVSHSSAGPDTTREYGGAGTPGGVGYMANAGRLEPVWLDDALLLLRRVPGDDGELLQGCWLEWRLLRRQLLKEILDLLTYAVLEPVTADRAAPRIHMSAWLPIQLLPGTLVHQTPRGFSLVEMMLLIAWSCMLLPAVAVFILLAGVISLNERRGAFVSAITHELRTPLTTFRLYTDMLENGMVSEGKRSKYIQTLRTEAERLSHLVENVLSYARLERGSPGVRLETMTVDEILERIREQLSEHAQRAGMRLCVGSCRNANPVRTNVDLSAVERILFNLVDNACKYAGSAPGKEIFVEADQDAHFAIVRVRDHGPGIAPRDARRLFRPFCKSASEAADSVPGVGLGLALSRRLARRMGGELTLDRSAGNADGACFILTMPVSG